MPRRCRERPRVFGQDFYHRAGWGCSVFDGSLLFMVGRCLLPLKSGSKLRITEGFFAVAMCGGLDGGKRALLGAELSTGRAREERPEARLPLAGVTSLLPLG